jgi:hypothetical protein
MAFKGANIGTWYPGKNFSTKITVCVHLEKATPNICVFFLFSVKQKTKNKKTYEPAS